MSFSYVQFFCGGLILLTLVQGTPLDDYVRRPDPSYGYQVIGQRIDPDEGYTLYTINMTSQTWNSENRTTTPVWWHYLSVVIPHDLDLLIADHSSMYLGIGDNTDLPPLPETNLKLNKTVEFALNTGVVTAHLMMIPNQPLNFTQDTSGRLRREDDAIAFTWRWFVDHPTDYDFIMRLPMVKAAVRAMDTVQDLLNQTASYPGPPIQRFMISGASKRGWTAYLVAAVDNRVFALVPKVLSCLNFRQNVMHHYRSMDGWSFAYWDYWSEDLMMFLEHPSLDSLMAVIDPYSYFDRLTMPKLIISAASDEFFLPDDSWYFWNDLPEPKYFWMVENVGHLISEFPQIHDIWESMEAFFLYTARGEMLPILSWTRSETTEDGSIELSSIPTPLSVWSWFANSTHPQRRDFRTARLTENGIEPSGVQWNPDVVLDLGNGDYMVTYDRPEQSFRAFFIEISFPVPGEGLLGPQLHLSTEVQIIPEALPFPPCQSVACYGTLV